MVNLTDRLDGIVGGKAATLLDEVFGIHTVDDLLRHYPRKYSHGTRMLGEDAEPPEEGEHITFVDEIEKADLRWTSRAPKRQYLVVTLKYTRPKVTATFFNAKYLKKDLVAGTRLTQPGEVGNVTRHLQLTHPHVLQVDPPRAGVF